METQNLFLSCPSPASVLIVWTQRGVEVKHAGSGITLPSLNPSSALLFVTLGKLLSISVSQILSISVSSPVKKGMIVCTFGSM